MLVRQSHIASSADQPQATSGVDAAIACVLAAEKAARLAVAECESHATALVHQAQVRARAIAERGATRAALAHDWATTAIAARLAAIEAQRQGLTAGPGPHTDRLQQLNSAVDQLADVLTGARGES